MTEASPNDYTILSAFYGNEDGTAVILVTKEHGHVVVSEQDRPLLWKKLQDSGILIGAMPSPATPRDPGEPIILSG